MQIKIGHGWDIHRLAPQRRLILGGVTIEHPLGLLGHSDADVLLHAVADAIIGALGKGDIGTHFADTNVLYANKNSAFFLEQCRCWLQEAGYNISNIDCTVIAQAPKLAAYKNQMRLNIAAALGIDSSMVNVKAKTAEYQGPVGLEQAIEASAVVLIYKSS